MRKIIHINSVLDKNFFCLFLIVLGLILGSNIIGIGQTAIEPNEIKMPYFFSDNMVIQRNKPIRFWGKGIASTSLQISFAGRKRTVFVSNRGDWDATFPSKKAGGPFTLQIKNKNKTTILKNIMIGDVWICSGQSNMEWPLYKSDSADQEIYSSDNDKIRHFFVPHQISSSLQNNTEASSWEICTKETAGLFTAVGYFFAKKIQQQTKIPIGIIHSTWGGTKARAWTSITGLQNLPEYQGLVDEFQIDSKSKKSIDAINQEYKQDTTEFKNVLSKKDKGYINRWYLPNINTSNWKRMTLPCLWEENALPNYDGIVWFKKQFNLSSAISESIFNLQLGVIDGMDDIWINGKLVSKDLWERSDRNILIKKGILKEGENNITICVLDTGGTGGFKAKAGEMKLKSMNPNKPLDISLEGEWYYEASTPLTELPQVPYWKIPYFNGKPSSLFNAMIAPFLKLGIKGFVWYQGEADANVATQYQRTFQNLIKDWRKQFKQGDLPFLFTQLSSFGKTASEAFIENNWDDNWAEIRESQAAALQLPNTGMAVTIDVGNPLNVHPTNKKTVGERLASEALKIAYHYQNTPSSPMLKDVFVEDSLVRLTFSNANFGLAIKAGTSLQGFTIAGEDKKFEWANAVIVNKNEVIVSYPTIKKPISVRYAWAASPIEANLINKEGYPVAPFRTDNWRQMTFDKKDN